MSPSSDVAAAPGYRDSAFERPGTPAWAWIVAAALLVVFAGLAWVARLPGIGSGNDDAIYYFLAKSLLHGSYRETFVPGAPFHVQYPPGWPAVLAVAIGLVGDRADLLLLLPLGFSVAGLLLLFDLGRRMLPPVGALAVLAIAAFNPLLVTYGGRLKAEAPFFFFMVLTFWALAVPAPSRRRLLLALVAAIAAAFMRSVGVAVIAALLLHFVLTRRWRWVLGFGVAALLTFGPWLGWSMLSARQVVGRSYAGDLVQVAGSPTASRPAARPGGRVMTVVRRAQRYVLGHLHAMMGFKQASGTVVDNAGWLLLLLTAGVAGLVVLWRRAPLVVLTLGAMLAVLSVWPWADRRFLHPVVPLVGLQLVAGAVAIGRRFGRAGPSVAALAVAGLLSPGTVWRTEEVVRTGRSCDHDRPIATCYTKIEQAYLGAARSARGLPDSAIVMVQREATFAYYSGRLGVYSDPATGADQAGFLAYLRDQGITHILISRVTRTEPLLLAEQLESHCRYLRFMERFGEGTELYQVLPAALPDTGDTATCRQARQRAAEARAVIAYARLHPDEFGLPEDREQ